MTHLVHARKVFDIELAALKAQLGQGAETPKQLGQSTGRGQ